MAEWYDDYNNWLKLLPIAGGIGGTILGNQYSQSAGNISQDAARQAASRFDPYATIGQENAWNQRNMLNAGPGNYQDYMNTDYYKFPYEQGIKAMERGAAAKGNQLGGRQLKALTSYGQQYAGSKYDEWMADWYKRLQAYQPGINAGLVASGQQASYDALGGMSQAAGQVNQGQNWADLINSLTKYGADVSTLNELKKVIGNTNGGTGTGTGSGIGTPGTGYNSGGDVTSSIPPAYDNLLGGDVTSSVGGTGTTAGGLYGAESLYGLGGDVTSTAPGFAAFSNTPGSAMTGMEASFAELAPSASGGSGAYLGGMGALGGAAIGVAWVAAFAAFMNSSWGQKMAKAISDGTGLGINPFTDETIPGNNPGESFFVKGPTKLVMAIEPGQMPSNAAEWLNGKLPDTTVFATRFSQETGIQPPKTTSEAIQSVEMFQDWLARQPEIVQVQQELQKWREENWSYEGGGEGGMSWVPKTADAMTIRTMAEGGVVTKPTLALIGEAGPEAVVPLGKFNPEAEFNKSKKSNRIFDLNTMSWVRR